MTDTWRRGFTLIELLIVLALVAVVSAFVGPDLWKQYEKTQEQAAVQDFVFDIQALRRESIATRKSVTLPRISAKPNEVQYSDYFPALAQGWGIVSASELLLLPTGATNGGEIVLMSPSGWHWVINLRVLDGHADLTRLRANGQ